MKRNETERLWQTSARCGLGVVGLAALTAVLYRLSFRSALLYLIVVVFVSLTGDFVASAVVSVVAFLCLAYFVTPPVFLFGLDDPRNVVALLGFLTTAFVVTRLVSRRRTSFQEIQILKEQLGLVIDSIPALSSLPEGSVEFVNHRWLEYTGMRREDPQGWGWRTVVHPDDRAAFADARRTAFARREPLEIEARMRRADGVYRWFLVRAAPVRDEAASSGGMACRPISRTERWRRRCWPARSGYSR